MNALAILYVNAHLQDLLDDAAERRAQADRPSLFDRIRSAASSRMATLAMPLDNRGHDVPEARRLAQPELRPPPFGFVHPSRRRPRSSDGGRRVSAVRCRRVERCQIAPITLGVEDLPRAMAFYRDVVGWTPASDQDGGRLLRPRWLHPRAPGTDSRDLGGRLGVAADRQCAAQTGSSRASPIAGRARSRRSAHLGDRPVARPIVKPLDDSVLGLTAYFADPDGHHWEIAPTRLADPRGRPDRLPRAVEREVAGTSTSRSVGPSGSSAATSPAGRRRRPSATSRARSRRSPRAMRRSAAGRRGRPTERHRERARSAVVGEDRRLARVSSAATSRRRTAGTSVGMSPPTTRTRSTSGSSASSPAASAGERPLERQRVVDDARRPAVVAGSSIGAPDDHDLVGDRADTPSIA